MSNATERIGVSYCALTAERNNWMFREQPINDIGIDAHMEFVEDDKPRQLLALQIKSGSSWFKEKKDDCIIFAYIRSEKDILKLVQTIIANTKGDGEKAGEDFWVKAEKLYYTALIGYIFYEAPREEKNFATLLDMIDASEVREDDETSGLMSNK